MKDVLFISKPVAPPWNDSNKNLVRDVARGLRSYRAHVLVPSGRPLDGVTSEPWYADAGSYAPSRWANARVLARLMTHGDLADVWHFFFGPNPLTLRAGRVAARFRRVPTVHTIASAPDTLEAVAPRLFADRVIVLSEHTRARLVRVGVNAVHIPPALTVPPVSPADVSAARARHALPARYLLFPGDLEFGNGAETFVEAAARGVPDLGWVIASRPKTPRAHEARGRLEALAATRGATVTWLGEVRDIHAIVRGAEMVALVSNTLHAKMDWPLVLLEALVLGVPVVVAEGTPAAELTPCGAAMAVPSGDGAALCEAVRAWRARDRDARRETLDRAAAWVLAQCRPEVVARRHEALYDEITAQR